MKKDYKETEFEVVNYETDDVICDSLTGGDTQATEGGVNFPFSTEPGKP